MKLKNIQNPRINKHLVTGYVFLGLVFVGAISSVYYWEYKAQTTPYSNNSTAVKHVESGESQVPRIEGVACEEKVVWAKHKTTNEVRDFPTLCHVNTEYWEVN